MILNRNHFPHLVCLNMGTREKFFLDDNFDVDSHIERAMEEKIKKGRNYLVNGFFLKIVGKFLLLFESGSCKRIDLSNGFRVGFMVLFKLSRQVNARLFHPLNRVKTGRLFS